VNTLEDLVFVLTDPYRDLDSPGIDFFKQIPFDRETARVVFTCGEPGACDPKELLVIDVPAEPPKVEILEPRGAYELKGRVRVASTNGGCGARYLLRYSNDGGRTFRAVAPSLSETEYTVDLDTLPGGERCRFQVLATEGIRTGSAVSDVFSVARKPRQVVIVADATHTEVGQGQTVRLRGFAFSPEEGSAAPRDLTWSSDKDGALGVGPELVVRGLSAGQHRISLQVPDGMGGTSVTHHEVRVVAPPVSHHTSRQHPQHTQRHHDTGEVPPR